MERKQKCEVQIGRKEKMEEQKTKKNRAKTKKGSKWREQREKGKQRKGREQKKKPSSIGEKPGGNNENTTTTHTAERIGKFERREQNNNITKVQIKTDNRKLKDKTKRNLIKREQRYSKTAKRR